MHPMHTDRKIEVIACDAAFVLLALALSYLESFLPLLALPGARIGLTNIALTVCAYRCSMSDAAAVSLCRIVISFLLFGNAATLIFSLLGSALSLLTLAFLKHHNFGFSFVGISVLCALAHNAGQLVAAYITAGKSVLPYAPMLVFASAVFGTLCGVVMIMLPEKIFKKGV
jgi:heptaprenyl diphosphate synthase